MKRTAHTDKPIVHVCAPASPAGEDLACLGVHCWVDLEAAVSRAIGSSWQVAGDGGLIWGPFEPDAGGRADDAARAADLEAALADERVRAIVPLRGGAWLLRILERIDLNGLEHRRNPVYLIGFSEWTCLSLVAARYRRAISVHHTSPLYMLATDPRNPLSDQQKQCRWRRIWASIRAIVEGRDPRRGIRGRLVAGDRPGARPVRLIGGNLTLMAAMAGTPYQPCAAGAGAWLAMEDVNETIGRVDRKFAQMGLAGMFEGVQGVLLGGFHSEGQDSSRAVARLLERYIPRGVPIVAGCNFGHFWPAGAFPVARPVKLVMGPGDAVRVEVDWGRLGGV